MNNENSQIYIIGYGNIFRQDDGLGFELIEMLRAESFQGVILDDKIQLSVDDVYNISESNAAIVFFVDASLQGDEPFIFYPVEPCSTISFSIPLLTPEAVISMCGSLFNKNVKGYVLGIRGYEWNFSAVPTSNARDNLLKAYSFMRDILFILNNNLYSFSKASV